MPQLLPYDFSAKWIPLLADNVFQNIDGPLLARFVVDIRDSFAASTAVANVPDWVANTYYAKDFVILYSGYQDFFKAKQAGYLPAPSDRLEDDNWEVALKPVAAEALYQQASLEAMRHARNAWVPNRLYIVGSRVDAGTGDALPDVYVRALSSSELEPEGYIIDATALVPAPARVRYDLDTDTAGPVPPAIDAYSKRESNALLNLKADLINNRVPTYQLPPRAVAGIDYINRIRSYGGTISIRGGDHWHTTGDVTLNLTQLAVDDTFLLRISSFASNTVWTRVLATNGKVFGAWPQGTAIQFRRTGYDVADLAVLTISSEYPSYAHAFVPTDLKASVVNGDYDASNRLTATPAGSEATMQFFDDNYLYFCFVQEQVANGVLTYVWFRVPRTGSGGGGGGSSYVLPAATATRRGGIKIGAGLAVDVDGVASLALAPYTTVEYAASLALDFAQPAQLLTLAGNLTISGTLNRLQGRELTLHLRNPAGSAAVLNWPGWKWRGAIPTSLAAGQEATLSLVGAWGAAESDIVAGFAAQP